LPISAQNPITGVNGNPVWNLYQGGSTQGDGQPYSWGGHCVPIVGYGFDQDNNTGSEVVSWGQIFDMTWGFFSVYCDEAYAIITQDWIEANGQSPSGFDIAALQADLAAL
jgi:hypothetical protein